MRLPWTVGIGDGAEFTGAVRWGKHDLLKDRRTMPLKALLDGQPILAPLLGDMAWAELYFRRHRLVLPCCPDRAVQMRGGAGTRRIQHFSHAPSPTCQFRGETTAHLLAKVEIARACAEPLALTVAPYARWWTQGVAYKQHQGASCHRRPL